MAPGRPQTQPQSPGALSPSPTQRAPARPCGRQTPRPFLVTRGLIADSGHHGVTVTSARPWWLSPHRLSQAASERPLWDASLRTPACLEALRDSRFQGLFQHLLRAQAAGTTERWGLLGRGPQGGPHCWAPQAPRPRSGLKSTLRVLRSRSPLLGQPGPRRHPGPCAC